MPRYQIYDPGIVDALIRAHTRGVQLTVLISANIFAGCDCYKARAAYTQLVGAGIRLRKSSATCTNCVVRCTAVRTICIIIFYILVLSRIHKPFNLLKQLAGNDRYFPYCAEYTCSNYFYIPSY
eukprot:COSAG05_NODE_2538_length_2931_cov_3.885593_5_plen_124_part_00